MTNDIRDALRKKAKELVNPKEERAALDLALGALYVSTEGILRSVMSQEDETVLERFDATKTCNHVFVYAAGMGREIVHFRRQGKPLEEETKVGETKAYRLRLLEPLVLAESLISPVHFGSWPYIVHQAFVVRAGLGTDIALKAQVAQVAYDTWQAEYDRRVEVYEKLILASSNLEQVLEEWPEIRGYYDAVCVSRSRMLPATLTNTDRSVLELDMGERKMMIVGEAPAQVEE